MYAPAPVRRRHRGRTLLIALVVLVGLLVALDRIALVVSERAAATTIRNSQQLSSTPSVSVSGFPFLTQLAAGHFHQITIKARDVPAGTGSPLTIDTVTVVLHSVHVSRDLRTVRADSAQASATVSYAALSKALGITVSYAGQADGVGRVQATGSVSLLGHTITAVVSSGVAVSDGELQFVDPQVNGASLPSAALPLLRNVFGAPLSISQLPFGVSVQGAQATPAGITIELTGAELVYTRS